MDTLISDVPEHIKPLSPVQDVDAHDESPLNEQEVYKSELTMSKRKLFKNENNPMALDLSSNSINPSPPKVVKENAVEGSHAVNFDGTCIPNANNGNTQLLATEIINTGINHPAEVPAVGKSQTINTTCPTISTEAEEIVRKLCKNGKVMEFQEGEDCIKVIVYEDSQEDSDEENNPSYANIPRALKREAEHGSSTASHRPIYPSSVQGTLIPTPAMPGQQPVHHTPHPRNGYMFYSDEKTPQSVQATSRSTPLTSTVSRYQQPYGPGITPPAHRVSTPMSQNVPLNSSGEENISPTDAIGPTSEQTQYREHSLINLPPFPMLGDNGNIKEQHNQKERRRRQRIKEACNLLRQLVPGMSDKTDKATVFEFAARYVYFLKSHTGPEFDKDFLMKYSPY